MHFIETGLSNEVLLVLYFVLNFGVLLYLEYKRRFSLIRKSLLMVIITSLVFSGNIIDIYSLNANIGIMFISIYYFILFLFIRKFPSEECFDLLKNIFNTFVITWIMTTPLIFFHYFGTLYAFPNLINDILIDRINYCVVILISFYFGVMLYLHSFRVVSYKGITTFKNFLFEYIVRIHICMILQSSIFYFLVSITSGILALNLLVPTIFNSISQGGIIRFSLFAISSWFVYKILKLSDKKYEVEKEKGCVKKYSLKDY